MERVTKSADACLTALNIMTSSHMPKAVYIEDVIERVLQYTKFHLQNTLYPQYDPVYRVDPHGGENEENTLFNLIFLKDDLGSCDCDCVGIVQRFCGDSVPVKLFNNYCNSWTIRRT